MSYYGDIHLGETHDFKFVTTSASTGAPTVLSGSPVISAYVDNGTTQLTAGITLSVDFDSVVGLNNVRVVATGGNGYAAGTNVQLVITTGTVGGTSAVGYVVGSFSIDFRGVNRWLGTAVATPATAGIPDVNAKNINNVATTSVTTINANIGATQPLNFTGTGASATVKTDVTNIATAAVSTTTAQLGVNVVQISGDGTAADNLETAFDDTAGAVPWMGIVDQGTAQSATGTTLVLRSAAAFADSELVGHTVVITGGTTGVGQSRLITASVGSTDTVTVDTWNTTPTGTITYKIYASPPASASSPAAANLTQILGTAVSTPATAGILDVNLKNIANATVSTSTAQLGVNVVQAGATAWASGAITAASIASSAFSAAKFAADTGLVPIRSNTAQAGAATTITLDASASASNNFYNNTLILLTGGTGAGQARFITAYVGSTKVATVATWTTNPDNTSTFAILPFDAVAGATAPTVGQIATAVWQDSTGSDFTASGSIGKSLFTSGVVPGASGGLFIAGTNAATTVTTAFTTTFTGNLTGSVASVTGAVGSVTARVTANTDQLAGQAVTAAAGVTFPSSVASPTNITAGTITTVTTVTTATNVTTVNGLAANVITAASIAADAGTEIGAAVLAAATAAPIAADMKKINATTVAGTGVLGDEWRP